jgi:hypothetical protein
VHSAGPALEQKLALTEQVPAEQASSPLSCRKTEMPNLLPLFLLGKIKQHRARLRANYRSATARLRAFSQRRVKLGV